MHTDAFEKEYRRMTDAVHEAGGKITVQLVHAGGQTSSEWAGRRPLAPSAVKADQFPETPEEMSREEIGEVVAAFGKAAGWAKEWGFDAVQLHGAHGYLINQFLSPLTNRRTDGYGGRVENRCRFLLEVYDAVRGAVGNGYPVCIKLNASDNVPGGLELEEGAVRRREAGGGRYRRHRGLGRYSGLGGQDSGAHQDQLSGKGGVSFGSGPPRQGGCRMPGHGGGRFPVL